MRVPLAIFIALFPTLGYAEVMDKEASLFDVLFWGLIGALLVFLSARLKPWLLFILLPVIGLFFSVHLSELMDPYVGPAMEAEAGQFYVVVSWVAPVLVLIGAAAGFFLRSRDVKTNT